MNESEKFLLDQAKLTCDVCELPETICDVCEVLQFVNKMEAGGK